MNKGLKEEIINLRKGGKTYKKIKDELKCSKGTISYHCRRAGLDHPNTLRVLNSKQIEDIITSYIELENLTKVSEKTGWSTTTIKKYTKSIRDKKDKLSPAEKKKRRSESVISWRKRAKIKLVEYKGGKCEGCGYNKCVEALAFHHLDPKEKDFSISGKSWSFEKLKKEVDKCSLVCATCHIEIHAGVREL